MSGNKVIRIKKQKKRKKKSIYSLIFLLLMTISCILLLTAPGFAIQKVSIEGNERFTDQEIEEILGIKNQKNMFYFLLRNKFYNDDELNPYIEDLKVEIKFPNAIDVVVKEREVVGYVPYLGTYLCIDKFGRVIDTSIFLHEDVPIIMGLDFKGFTMNEILNVENESTFTEMVNIVAYLVKYEALGNIIKLDMTNLEHVVMYTRNIEIRMGRTEDIHQKVNIMVQALKEVANLRGILTISDLDQPITFKKS